MRFARTLMIVAILALAATPVMAATAVTVPGRAGWISTGLTVTAGQTLTIQTLGSVHTAPIPAFHIPGEFKSASGPEGQVAGDLCGVVTATFPPELLEMTGPCAFDDAYFGELIGRIGDTTFAIGDADSFVAPATGTLELAVNDLTLTYFDNTGTFIVLFR